MWEIAIHGPKSYEFIRGFVKPLGIAHAYFILFRTYLPVGLTVHSQHVHRHGMSGMSTVTFWLKYRKESSCLWIIDVRVDKQSIVEVGICVKGCRSVLSLRIVAFLAIS